jgi:methylated-DNA-[protein]-cysteine S-methyltransferase
MPTFFHAARLVTPFAVLGIATRDEWLTGIDFLAPHTPPCAPSTPLAREAARQLAAYLADPAFVFDLPLDPAGTPFRQRVWQALRRIPPGEARSYGELAASMGSAPRAVGQACGDNPIPLLIPCHRVLAKNGPGGFMHARGGHSLAIKHWLLRHEGCRRGAA